MEGEITTTFCIHFLFIRWFGWAIGRGRGGKRRVSVCVVEKVFFSDMKYAHSSARLY